jgi:hypothetical protein
MDAAADPYFTSYNGINFDGSGLTRLTAAGSNHAAAFSSDMQFYVDTYSRVDTPPVVELRRASDNALLSTVERGDISHLVESGWNRAARFVRPEVVFCLQPDAGTGRTRLHRGADRRHRHVEPFEGVPRCGVEEPRRCGISR